MLDTATIEELIARVEKLTWPDREVDGDLAMLLKQVPISLYPVRSPRQRELWSDGRPGLHARTWSAPPYTRSTDAILELIERLGFDYILEHTNGGITISALVGTSDPDKRVFADTPALALTLALLRAKLSEMADA